MEISKEQGSEHWHKSRAGLITASNVGAILDCDPYRGPDDVMRAMVRAYHGAEPEFAGNVATWYGTFHETGARIDYQLWTGNIIEQCGFFVLDSLPTEHGPWLGASPDGLINRDGLIEIKCPYGLRDGNGDFKPLAQQPHYYAQIQIQLFVTERKWCDFFQWCSRAHVVERVYQSNDWLSEYLPKLRAFYDRYLIERESPELHLEEKRKVIENEMAGKLLREYDEVVDQLDFAQQRKKEIIAELAAMAKDRNALVCGRKLTKVESAGAVSYAQVVKKYCPHIDVEPFRGKPSVSWRLS